MSAVLVLFALAENSYLQHVLPGASECLCVFTGYQDILNAES